MSSVTFGDGGILRSWDHQPLKTKIVATIGGPESYTDGLYDLDLHKMDPPIPYKYIIRGLVQSGVDVIRLNMAYMDEKSTRSFVRSVEEVVADSTEHRPRFSVLVDLPGPRILFERAPQAGIPLRRDQLFTIHFGEDLGATKKSASVLINGRPLKDYSPEAYESMMDQVERKLAIGEQVRVAVGDGQVIMDVVTQEFMDHRERAALKCRVVKDGVLGKDRFTLRNTDFTIPSFTGDDQRRIEILFESGAFHLGGVFAFVGLSFTQSAKDVLNTKEHLERKFEEHCVGSAPFSWHTPHVIAKIETRMGYSNREDVLNAADGIMVARGDLGVQMDIEEIGSIQKRLIELCNQRGKPVITATQMLSSMKSSLEPLRAEVMDVFNSILDGTDAVMLSGETSKGCYPFHAVQMMAQIAGEAERFHEKVDGGSLERRTCSIQRYQDFLSDAALRIQQARRSINDRLSQLENEISSYDTVSAFTAEEQRRLRKLRWRRELYEEKLRKLINQQTTDSITQSACINSESERIRAILALTTTGRTARMISRFRPTVQILGATHDRFNASKLMLSYGVIPYDVGMIRSEAGPGEMLAHAAGAAKRMGLLNEDDRVIFTSGNRPRIPGATNTLQIQQIKLLPKG